MSNRRGFWEGRPPDVLLVSPMVDDMTIRHMDERLHHLLANCSDLECIGTNEDFGHRNVLFRSTGRPDSIRTTISFHEKDTRLIYRDDQASCTIAIKARLEDEKTPTVGPKTPSAIVSHAIACLRSTRTRLDDVMTKTMRSERILARLHDDTRSIIVRTLRECNALLIAANPHRSEHSVVRIQMPNPWSRGSITDHRGARLFNASAEAVLMRPLPSIVHLESTMHGHLSYEEVRIGMNRAQSEMDPMDVIRIVSGSPLDPGRDVLTAGRG